jgi:ketosteroid isomerase-like protein
MSEENVEIVRRFYDSWADDEFPGPIELMDPEIEYEGWEAWEMEPQQFRAAGDQVAVVVRYRAKGRGSGVEVEGRESALWTLRDGKVARYAWFHEPMDAFDAAGLAE